MVVKVRCCNWYRNSESVVVLIYVIVCDYCGVVMCIIDLHNVNVVCRGFWRRSSVNGFVTCLVEMSFWSTMDCARSVSYCVTFLYDVRCSSLFVEILVHCGHLCMPPIVQSLTNVL